MVLLLVVVVAVVEVVMVLVVYDLQFCCLSLLLHRHNALPSPHSSRRRYCQGAARGAGP
jgi:hypothetical protein